MFARLSVVIPVYNERENLKNLTSRLQATLKSISVDSFEVLYVDDGSRDGSDAILDAISAADPRYKVLHFSRNFGHQAALQAGLDAATGDAVVLMDADLQDPPELLGKLVAVWQQGFDVVYAVRKGRKEALWKRFCYQLFYRSLRFIAEIDTPIDAGDFCLMDRRVVDTLVSLREQNRFLRGLRSWVGFRQTGVEYEREARKAGAPKYTLRKLIRLAVSGYVGFSSLPLRIAAWLGLAAAVAGFLVSIWVIASRLASPTVPQGWASTTAVILFIGGVQLMVLGVMGEYLSRVYDEVRRRPLYIVRSQTGISNPSGTLRRSDEDQPGIE
jgi:dolichol-phosphate mannosyltransferase